MFKQNISTISHMGSSDCWLNNRLNHRILVVFTSTCRTNTALPNHCVLVCTKLKLSRKLEPTYECRIKLNEMHFLPSRKLSEYLMLRDTTLIPNILWFEYTITRQEARVRTRKMHKKWHCWLLWHAASIKLTLLQFYSNRWKYVYRTKPTSENY